MLNGYYTISEAAPMIGVSRATLHRWVKQGKLKPLSIWGRSCLTLFQLAPFAVKKCSTCHYHSDGLCSCRSAEDVINGCSDWEWKWN